MGHWPQLENNEQSVPDSPPQQLEMFPVIEPNRSLPSQQPQVLAGGMSSDTILEKSPTGRTRRLINVNGRRARLNARRRQIAGKGILVRSQTRKGNKSASATDIGKNEGRTVASFSAVDSLYDVFEKVVVINLERREDRLERFYRHLAEIGWPFRHPTRFRAVDGRATGTPSWWTVGGGAWGCHQSHVQIIEQALMDDLESILILEDDVIFDNGFSKRIQKFLSNVPSDWQQLYLGGQHLFQRKRPPEQINDYVVRPFNVNRTHAYALHRRGMKLVYQWLTDYAEHSLNSGHHVDHRLGELHGAGEINVYAPTRWLAGQTEGLSDIKGKQLATKFWHAYTYEKRTDPFVAVIGLHRSGSSCLAGVLHKLGVHMGDRLQGYEGTGGFEARGLARICEKAYPFPSTKLAMPSRQLENHLNAHVLSVQSSARSYGKPIAGGKYPHLCAMGESLSQICGDKLRVIHINRPLEESIASLLARSKKSKGWLKIRDDDATTLQNWLWDRKQQFLNAVDHLTIEYEDLLAQPRSEINRIIRYLEIEPKESEIESAVAHVQPDLRKQFSSPELIVGQRRN